MAKICPYCGEEQTALKNHVRLASGGGHGPSGQYPDEFGDDDQDDGDDDPGGAAAASATGGGGTVTVEAVEETETSQEPPDVEEEPEEDEESLIAMPESELNEMLQSAAATAGEAVSRDDKETEESTSADEEDTSVDTPSLDPDDVAEKAEENGWGLGAVLLLFILAVAAGIAWSAIQDAAEDARQKGQQLTQRGEANIPVV